jgi:hypothetical protein
VRIQHRALLEKVIPHRTGALPRLESQARSGADLEFPVDEVVLVYLNSMTATWPWHLGRNWKSLASRLGPLLSLCLPKRSAWRGRSPIWRLEDGCRMKSFSLCHQLRALCGPLTAATPFESLRLCRTCPRLLPHHITESQLDLCVLLRYTAFFGCSRSATSSYLGSWRTNSWSSCCRPQFPVDLVGAELVA